MVFEFVPSMKRRCSSSQPRAIPLPPASVGSVHGNVSSPAKLLWKSKASDNYFRCCRSFSPSRQTSSINSVSTIRRSLIVTVHGFV